MSGDRVRVVRVVRVQVPWHLKGETRQEVVDPVFERLPQALGHGEAFRAPRGSGLGRRERFVAQCTSRKQMYHRQSPSFERAEIVQK